MSNSLEQVHIQDNGQYQGVSKMAIFKMGENSENTPINEAIGDDINEIAPKTLFGN